eukprot:TRINITY_DN3254_c0_g1_i1.p1 TRINITY_DN3254_c0_g1~~TRINITY_DN3254_c0_g1_i1.p1  ORF type:complete len:423 (+),score=38.12 TRINITY_DN3254_c0_g1_i1:58-1326(+)
MITRCSSQRFEEFSIRFSTLNPFLRSMAFMTPFSMVFGLFVVSYMAFTFTVGFFTMVPINQDLTAVSCLPYNASIYTSETCTGKICTKTIKWLANVYFNINDENPFLTDEILLKSYKSSSNDEQLLNAAKNQHPLNKHQRCYIDKYKINLGPTWDNPTQRKEGSVLYLILYIAFFFWVLFSTFRGLYQAWIITRDAIKQYTGSLEVSEVTKKALKSKYLWYIYALIITILIIVATLSLGYVLFWPLKTKNDWQPAYCVTTNVSSVPLICTEKNALCYNPTWSVAVFNGEKGTQISEEVIRDKDVIQATIDEASNQANLMHAVGAGSKCYRYENEVQWRLNESGGGLSGRKLIVLINAILSLIDVGVLLVVCYCSWVVVKYLRRINAWEESMELEQIDASSLEKDRKSVFEEEGDEEEECTKI